MNNLIGPSDARNDGLRSRPLISALLQVFGVRQRRTVNCCNFPGVAIVSIHKSEFGLANPYRVLQRGLEDRPQLARRA